MSVENLEEYARRCAADPELSAAAREIGMADMAEHMRRAESLGLSWDRSDLVAFQKEAVDSQAGLADLSEEELEEIAGGVITTTAAVAVGVGAAAGAVVGGAGAAGAAGGVTAAGDGGW